MITSSYFRRFGACLAVLTGLGLASCTSDSKDSTPTVAQTIFVVAEDNTQSRLLTEIYAQSLEKGGFRVSRRDPVKDLAAGYALLKAGTVDFFIAHTGELLDYLAANEPAAASTSTTAAATTTTGLDATSTTTAASTETTTGETDDTTDTTGDTTGDTTDTTGDSTATTAKTTSTTAKPTSTTAASTATSAKGFAAHPASTDTTDGPTTTAKKASTTTAPDTTDASDTTEATDDSTATTVPTLDSSDIPTSETATTLFDATSTTVPTPGNAAAVSINGQSNLIGQILPDSLQIGAASDAEDKSVIACNAAVSTTGSLVTLSDVARGADIFTLAAPKDFETTDATFGLAGFQKVYGDVTFKKINELDPAKVGEAITSPTTTIDTSVSTTVAPTTTEAPTTTVVGPAPTTAPAATTTTTIPSDLLPDADCVATNSLDITMPNDAVIMDDDKNWIETNGIIPVLTATAFTPGVQQVVDQISQQLTTGELRVMLAAISSEPTSPEAMASRYIASKESTGS